MLEAQEDVKGDLDKQMKADESPCSEELTRRADVDNSSFKSRKDCFELFFTNQVCYPLNSELD